MLHGIAGTGKSFISIYLALKQILSGNSPYKKLVIVRSVVPTREMGFLPGNSKEKAKVYEAPYYAICTELFGRGDDSIIIVDEIANCTLHELDSVITRVGKNCKIMFCGDFRQSDFTKEHERNGLIDFMKVIQRMKSFVFVDFNENDIVRSAMVKDYIIQKDRLKIIA